jgi:ABC-type branched-subunit amino acid transport system substrate-binding protein
MTTRQATWFSAVAIVALVATACGGSGSHKAKPSSTSTSAGAHVTSAPPGGYPPVNQPGATPTEIRVSGVASTTNPTGVLYGTAFDGVQAYFDMVNSEGGVYGRRLVLANRHDDQTGSNRREVEAIVDQDHPFAVLPVSVVLFTGSDLLAKAGIPTFGWNIQDDWTGPQNFFAQTGALCNGSACPNPTLPWVAQKLGRKRVAVLAYTVAQSADCADMIKASFDKYPSAKVVVLDKSLAFGVTDLSADVKKMADAKVDLVTTCMDANGVLTLAREMRQQGVNAVQYFPDGYDHEFMSKYGGFFEGSIVGVQEAPLETKPPFPALTEFVKWMDKGGYRKTENAEVGWVNAAQFVAGLRAAGPDFTQQKVVDAINHAPPFDAGGMIAPLTWPRAHTDKHSGLRCTAFVKVHDSKFVPQFSPAGKPFTCLDPNLPDVTKAQPTYLK